MATTGAPPEHVKRTEKTMLLACKLTPAEFTDRAHSLAQTTTDMAEETARADSMKTQMKAAMAELEARRTKLSSIVSRGEEFRDVKVTIIYDYERATVTVHREDTLEIVEDRPMRSEERQVKADLK